jgi:hypothetical protein
MLTSILKPFMAKGIQSSEYNVFFRKDFADLGGSYAQVGVLNYEYID